jgi:hypothetical protein
MGVDFFIYISNMIEGKHNFFEQRTSTGLLGHSTLEKTTAMQIMAYGILTDIFGG